MFTPALRPFTLKTPAKPQHSSHGTENYSCTLFQDYLVFYGGEEDREITGAVSVYNLRKKAIEQNTMKFKTVIEVPRKSHSACYLKGTNTMILYGGINGLFDPEPKDNLSLVFQRDRDGLTWGSKNGLRGPLLNSPISHSVDNKLYFYQPGQARGNFGSLYHHDLDENEVSELPLADDTGLQTLHMPSKNAIFSGNKLYLFAGPVEGDQPKLHIKDSILQDVYVIDPTVDDPKWKKISVGGQAPGMLSNISITEADGVIYIFGLKDSKACLWTFNIHDEQWNQIADIGELEAGPNQKAVIYDEHLLIINWSFVRKKVLIQKKALSELGAIPQSGGQKRMCRDEPEELVRNFKSLADSRAFADVVFEVEGEDIPAHKALLAYRSDYFMKMFTSDMLESSNAKINIPNMKSHIFKALLQYVYCNEVELDEPLALELIPVVDEYVMKGLKGLCEKYLCKQLRKDNAVDLVIVADRHEIDELKKACFRFILKNLGNIDENEQMMKLSKPLFFELLKFQTLGEQINDSKHQPKKQEEEQESTFDSKTRRVTVQSQDILLARRIRGERF